MSYVKTVIERSLTDFKFYTTPLVLEQVFNWWLKESILNILASPDHASMEYNLAIGTNTDSWRMSLLAAFNKFAHLKLQIYENQNLLKKSATWISQSLTSRDWQGLRTFLMCSCLQMLNSTNPSLKRTHDNNNKGFLP